MKIGILCGGGDVPGLNPCIKALVLNAVEQGASVFGIKRGWSGLLQIDSSDTQTMEEHIFEFTPEMVRRIDRFGITILNSSRANPARIKRERVPSFVAAAHIRPLPDTDYVDITPHILKVVECLGLEAIIAIGGDDTLSSTLSLQKAGLNVISIPKTMDNDIFGTDYCLGFSTAVSRSIECINSIRSVAGSHERIAVIELFGRTSGETSLISAYLAYADRAFIPEVPYDANLAAERLSYDKRNNPNNYAIAVISEGASSIDGGLVQSQYEDAYGYRRLGGSGQQLAAIIREKTGFETIYQSLGYLMRSGEPDALDRMVARAFAKLAIELVMKGEFGRLVGIREGKYTHLPLEILSKGSRRVDIEELYESAEYRPMVSRLVGKPMFLY
jgi:6-phosphofructokinase 1